MTGLLNTDAEIYALDHDRTIFSRLTKTFNDFVLRLLAEEDIPGVNKDKLAAFKRSYASSAFRCRYSSCPNATVGFASDQLRAQHEALHLRRQFCKTPSCSWSRIGFQNRKGLEAHMRSVHNEKTTVSIPPKVRRTPENRDCERREDPPDSIAASSPPSPTGAGLEAEIVDVGNALDDLDIDALPKRFKREGPDWYAIFNPRVRRVLDVYLVHDLPHQSVVCCVRFSSDGLYLATGCNRYARIFDVETALLTTLLDHYASNDDIYVRCVSFSPDGKTLATGSEDKIIRVCWFRVSGGVISIG